MNSAVHSNCVCRGQYITTGSRLIFSLQYSIANTIAASRCSSFAGRSIPASSMLFADDVLPAKAPGAQVTSPTADNEAPEDAWKIAAVPAVEASAPTQEAR